MASPHPAVSILGTRGVPAAHGGFETVAEQLALYLTGRGWDVTVYCQESGPGPIREDRWQNVRRVTIPVRDNAWGTVQFDWMSIRHALRRHEDRLFLTFGYNTAVFNLAFRMARRINVINMDGIEWKRRKWGPLARAWLYLNERAACWIGHRLIADHPEIEAHLSRPSTRGKITMIPYGMPEPSHTDPAALEPFGLKPQDYLLVIARPEPENSILQIVRSFSAAPRQARLVVLGHFRPESIPYHFTVRRAAGRDVLFPGAIYDPRILGALRSNAKLYIHGHTVGGTNPSLVEALAAGSPVLAHDNRFNRWVAGDAAVYFHDESSCRAQFDHLIHDRARLERMRQESKARFFTAFQLGEMLEAYEEVLLAAIRADARMDARSIRGNRKRG